MTIIALVCSIGMKRNMPASGDSPLTPKICSSCGISLATSTCCRVNTPMDMPFSQSTSKVSMVRR